VIRAIRPVSGARGAGVCTTAAGLLQLALGLTAGVFPQATSGSSPWTVLSACALLLLVAGLGGLAVTELAGSGRLAIIGLAVAIAGAVTDLLAHVIAAIDPSRPVSPLFPVGEIGIWLGMVLTGAAVLRARRWPGRGRFLPLACGLYPLAAVLPAYLLGSGRAGYLVGAGLGLLWAAFGLGLSRVGRSWLPPTAPPTLGLHRTRRRDDPAHRP
jgi:hypothetical protein